MTDSLDLTPLKKLTDNTNPIWGKMTSQHMVEHLIQAIQLSNGTLEIKKCMNPIEKLPILKRILMSNRPLPKNFVNTVIGEYLKPLVFANLDEAKEILISEVEKIEYYFESNPEALPNNPTFGPLNREEWIQFHKKHLRHHFEQFGLIEG